jgi:type VI secretion system secreted protein VgrG
MLEEDIISNIEKMQEIRIGKYSTKDFNFETPQTSLLVEAPSQYPLGPGEREVYDYPGEFYNRVRGDAIANLRIQAEEARITRVTGSGNCRSFASGYRFKLTDHLREDMNIDYVLLSVSHVANQGIGGSEDTGGKGGTYSNSFTCIPHNVPLRPSLNTPKPIIAGTQTAIVVGPAGEEIYTDQHGRIKVQFHWDREGKNDENSSCWIRVSQLWAGAGWGAMWIPRIGHEVIVEFVEGDPDRPIITGRVYHGNNTPPYPLPDEKTKSTIKSDSSKGGGGSNEIRFEDKKGEEEIYIHGQKDETIVIENDKNQQIGHDETLSVGNDREKSVGNNQNESIGVNKSISVGENHTESIGENANINIGENFTTSIGNNLTLTVGKNASESIGEKMDTTIGKEMSIQVGKDSTTQIGENMAVSVGKKLNIQAKDQINIFSDKQIVLKAGSASIALKKNGDIIIKGGKVSVKASGDIIMKGSKIKEN